jgi:hypothetical protein
MPNEMTAGRPTISDLAYNLELYAKGFTANPNILLDVASVLRRVASGELQSVVHAHWKEVEPGHDILRDKIVQYGGSKMKNLNYLNQYRLDVRHIFGSNGDEHNGAFKVFVNGRSFFVIASNGGGWEHVSVTPCNQKRKTCPTWEEMCQIKAMFFEPEETVIQYHPAESEYVNNHEYCLHLWRPIGQTIPTPPKEFV